MPRAAVYASIMLLIGHLPFAQAQTLAQATRGELLYTTHCGACHSAQIHWRQNKAVTDQASLVSEVRRWQRNAGQSWSDQDVQSVARYLNSRYYLFPTARSERAQ